MVIRKVASSAPKGRRLSGPGRSPKEGTIPTQKLKGGPLSSPQPREADRVERRASVHGGAVLKPLQPSDVGSPKSSRRYKHLIFKTVGGPLGHPGRTSGGPSDHCPLALGPLGGGPWRRSRRAPAPCAPGIKVFSGASRPADASLRSTLTPSFQGPVTHVPHPGNARRSVRHRTG